MIGNLARRSEQTENELVQQNAHSTRRTLARWAFADHMDRLVAGDGTPSSPE
jgi:NH3-dependent NAD+ synthetase